VALRGAGGATVFLGVDTSGYYGELSRAEMGLRGSASRMQGEVSRLERGAIAGSGAFRGLGRSIAFASTAFIGAAGFTQLVRSSITASNDLEGASKTLNAQITAGGESSKAAAPYIQRLDDRMAKLGHTSTETELALSALTRATGSVVKATQLMTLAADLAAAKHITLEQAAVLVGKVWDGNVSALNRYGIAIQRGTTVTDAIRIAQEKLAGQARANTTEAAKFHAQLVDEEAVIGRQLMPTINDLLGSMANWLSSSKNQATVQRDVKAVVDASVGAFHAAKDVIEAVDGVTGGFKNTLELLLGLKVVSILNGWTAALGLFTGSEACGDCVSGAAGATGLLNRRLGILRGLASTPFKILIAYEIIKGITGSNADLSNDTSNSDLVPVYRGGMWVNPVTGEAVQDQAYWNRQFKRSGGTGKPLEGQQSSGIVTKSGAPPTSYANRVKQQTAGITALQGSLPGSKGSNAISYPGHAAKSYHYSGEALDIGDGGNPAALISDWNYLYPFRQNFAELIWDPPANVQAMAPGSGAGYFWGIPGKFSDHTDHIHVAFTGSAADFAKLDHAIKQGKLKHDVKPPPTGGNASKQPDVPYGLQQSLADAQGPGGSKHAEVAALNAIIQNLDKQIASTKAGTKKAVELTKERNSFYDQLKALKKAGPKKTGDLVPLALENAVARAALTKNLNDDLHALQAVEDYLVKRIAKAKKNSALLLQLQQQLKTTRDQIASINLQLQTTPGHDPVAYNLSTPDATRIAIAQSQSGGNVDAQVAALQLEADRLQRLLDAKQQPSDFGLGRFVTNGPPLLSQEDTATTIDNLNSVKAAIKQLLDDQASQAAQAAQDSADAAAKAASDFESSLLEIPASLRLAFSKAVGAGDIPAETSILTSMKNLLVGRQQMTTNLETQVALQDAINSEGDQIAGLLTTQKTNAEEQTRLLNQNIIGYLAAQRAIRDFESNVYQRNAGMTGGTVIVNNSYLTQPEDPHSWSAALQFELGALTA